MFRDRTGTPLEDIYEGTTNLERVRALGRVRTVRAASMEPGVSVAVLNLNRPDLVRPLAAAAGSIASALDAQGLGFEMLIGDTGSTDPEVLELLDSPPDHVTCVRDLTYHFSRTNNDLCDGRVRFSRVLLLNNDVLLRSAEPLLHMLRCLEDSPTSGIVGAVLDFPNGKLQHGGIDVVRSGPLRGVPVHFGTGTRRPHQVGRSWSALAATGAALMIRTEVWQTLGGLDESYAKECQDVDLCLRAHRLGWSTRVVDPGPLVHEENGTRPKGEEHWGDRRLFLRRWSSYVEAVFL